MQAARTVQEESEPIIAVTTTEQQTPNDQKNMEIEAVKSRLQKNPEITFQQPEINTLTPQPETISHEQQHILDEINTQDDEQMEYDQRPVSPSLKRRGRSRSNTAKRTK
jgi:hypothetical protein